MTGKPKKPAGWYSAAAKAERVAARAARRDERAAIVADAIAERERKAVRADRAKKDADRLGAEVERKARDSRASREAADRDYRRQAKALRKELVDGRGDPNVGPNPHTRRHQRKTGFQRMIERREITPEMFQAAQEIERVYMAICGAVMGRTQSYEPRSRATPLPMTDKTAWAHAKRYKPWADGLARITKRGGWPMLEIVIDVVVEGRSLDSVDTDKRLAHGTAKFVVRRCLLTYAEEAGWASRGSTAQFEHQHGARRRPLAA